MRMSHIGIAVRDINAAVNFSKDKFGFEATDRGTGRGFHVAFVPTGGSQIELIQDVSPGRNITKFVEKKGEGVHHISFEVEDIRVAMEKMEPQGVHCLDKEPKKALISPLLPS